MIGYEVAREACKLFGKWQAEANPWPWPDVPCPPPPRFDLYGKPYGQLNDAGIHEDTVRRAAKVIDVHGWHMASKLILGEFLPPPERTERHDTIHEVCDWLASGRDADAVARFPSAIARKIRRNFLPEAYYE